MHPKNPFVRDYDFDHLVNHDELLEGFVFLNKHGNKTIRFGDPQAVRALNRALLQAAYAVKWSIPEGFLCPPIPGRLDYLLYVADLVEKKDIRLLDVGTGSSLIYPILGTCHFKWTCVGSEIDREAADHAQSLIELNPSLAKTEVRVQANKKQILKKIILPDEQFDVLVCNPPFYKTAEEAMKENRRKVKNLGLKKRSKLNFGGNANELWTHGGEVTFVSNLAAESQNYKTQVGWFTSLVSRKEHLSQVKRAITQAGATEVRVIEMGTGNKMSRFVAWRFS